MIRPPLLVASHLIIAFGTFLPSSALADVVINEIKAESSEYLIRYHEDGSQTIGPGDSWWAPGFDDSEWQTGALPAGHHSAGVATDLTAELKNRATTLYTRKAFTASAAAAAATAITLSANYNDGIVVWINGTEVARSNMGPSQGHFHFDQGAYRTGSANRSEFEDFDIGEFADALVEGENVIAIQLANIRKIEDRLPSGPPSTTTWIDFSLTAGGEELVAAGSEVRLRPGFAEPSGGVADFGALLDPEVESDFSDWVELHNNGAADVDLTGWSLTDEVTVPDKWTFPDGTTIAAGGYLVVLADKLSKVVPTADYLHVNFNLSSGGEYLGVFDSNGAVQSAFDPEFPSQDAFHSYGRSGAGDDYVFFDSPTPGNANAGASYIGRVDAPDFDNGGGFYDATVTTTLTSETEGARIRYTTDGTDPTEANGMDYSAPLTLAQVSDDSGHVIRARAFIDGRIPSRIKTHTFLIGQDERIAAAPALIYSGDVEKALYKPYGVMSIEGGTGIGNAWRASNPYDYNNVINRGRAYERQIHGEYYMPGGEVGFRTNMGVRVAASNWSRPRMRLTNPDQSPWQANSEQKPSFNIYFRNDYGNPSVTLPLNGNSVVDTFEKFRIRAGKNDISNPFVVDELVRRLHRDMGSMAATGDLNSLYVNGELKGFYNMVERLRSPFFGDHHGQTPGAGWDVLAYAYDVNENVAEGDKVAWDDMIERLEVDEKTQENWEKALELADPVSIADYFLLNIFTAMWDWPHNNWVAARERSEIGRYRLYVWDAEGGFGNTGDSSATKNSIGTLNSGSGELQVLWQRLTDWPQYRLLFADRINKHLFNSGILDDRDYDTSHVKVRTDELITEFADLQRAVGNERLNVESKIKTWGRATGRRANLLGPRREDFANADLWPATAPPEFGQFGGSVVEGFKLGITSDIGTVYYTTNGEDPRDASGEPNPGAGSLAGSKLAISILEKGTTWKYNDDGVDLGTDWRTNDYDDSAWKQGPAPLGYGGITGTDIATTMNTDRANTSYLRGSFELEDASVILSLEAEVHVDSGCVVYINGQEALRDGFVADDGEILFDSRPAKDGNEGEFDVFVINTSLLRAGTNVIAIDVKNKAVSGGSSDMVIDFALAGTRTSPDSAPIPINRPMTVKARTLYDGEWSALTAASFTVNTTPASSANVAVAEMLYNPVGPSDTEIAAGVTDGDQFEFVEIRNTGAQNVDLNGLRFTDGVAFDFSGGNIQSIAPGQHVIVVSDLAAFQLRYGNSFDAMIAGEYVGNFNNGGENVRLTGANDRTLHEYAYSDSAPWPIEGDNGYSLQIVNSAGDHAEPTNWKVSSAVGGNPGPDSSTPPVTLAQWQSTFFSEEELQNTGISGPDADADGDLVSNFAEFVFGTSPRDSAARPSSPRGGLMANGDGNSYITVTITIATEPRAITFSGESSTDLASWAGATVERVSETPLGDGRTEVTYRNVAPVQPGKQSYLRLRMTAQ